MNLSTSWLYAHPPEKVVLSYDQDTHSLTAEVVHPVSDPGLHFVNRIRVGKYAVSLGSPHLTRPQCDSVDL